MRTELHLDRIVSEFMFVYCQWGRDYIQPPAHKERAGYRWLTATNRIMIYAPKTWECMHTIYLNLKKIEKVSEQRSQPEVKFQGSVAKRPADTVVVVLFSGGSELYLPATPNLQSDLGPLDMHIKRSFPSKHCNISLVASSYKWIIATRQGGRGHWIGLRDFFLQEPPYFWWEKPASFLIVSHLSSLSPNFPWSTPAESL